ncbi:TPA: hypothetical protein WJA41_001089 [Neisseria meningitidis]|nr:hypothetical protein [Neisseria meningitidis]
MPSEIFSDGILFLGMGSDADTVSGRGGKTKNLSFNLLFPRVFVKIYQFVFKIHCSKWDKTGKLTFM